jgi:RNA polymerase sigma-70 factor (ECF subfamily)
MSHPVAERVARTSSGRLVALLARRTGDLAMAEDALSGALVAALEQWPTDGVPRDPEGWLYTVARRALADAWRRQEVRDRKAPVLAGLQSLTTTQEGQRWPDERLPLLFVCAHPAIDPRIRAPLMLQTVLGLPAESIGPLVNLPAKTLGQRLWRAKRKIRDAGIPFVVPEGEALGERVDAVLDAIYGLYTRGWSSGSQGEVADEALWLAEVVVEVLPDDPEALGLLALLQYSAARRTAHRADGYVPLDAQDPADWDDERLQRADTALFRARAHDVIGPFQLEAALQSALVHGRRAGRVDHAAILALYDGLVALRPTLGVWVGRAAAIAASAGPAAGLEALDALEGAAAFQPYHAVRADLLSALGDPRATAAYDEAIARCDDPATRAFLETRRG